jgi:hypothetical protein
LTDELGQLRLYSSNTPVETPQTLITQLWGWTNNLWTPDDIGNTIPLGTSYLRLQRNVSPYDYVDISLIISDNDPQTDTPLLAISQGVVIKKDLSVGGFLASNQGIIALGSGLHNSFDPPGIWLTHSESSPLDYIEYRDLYNPPTNPAIGQCFRYATTNRIYQWDGSSWVDKGSANNYNYHFDTCYIRKASYDANLPFNTPCVPIDDAELGNLACYDVTSVTSKVKDATFFYADQDQFRFLPSGYDGAIWTYKPSEGKIFGLWDIGAQNWRFYVNTNGDVQCYGNVLPATANYGNVGSFSNYWGSVCANYLCYHTDYAYYFDEYDDLALVKLWGEKTQSIPENYDKTKTKPPANDPFAILKTTNEQGEVLGDFFHVEKMQSFALSCAKALAKKQDELEKILLQLLNEMERLNTEITDLHIQFGKLKDDCV